MDKKMLGPDLREMTPEQRLASKNWVNEEEDAQDEEEMPKFKRKVKKAELPP
jgi:hypothetical protein